MNTLSLSSSDNQSTTVYVYMFCLLLVAGKHIVIFGDYMLVNVSPSTQGIYNRLLLVRIVGSACFQRHQSAAVFYALLSIFQMTLEISRINRMGRGGNFCDVALTHV